ncbi:hypothetical protein ACX3VG_16055, partial [Escherichia coli]
MRRWISQNNIRLPRGAFFISALFFFNAVCIAVSYTHLRAHETR